jgi:hypothetical protein
VPTNARGIAEHFVSRLDDQELAVLESALDKVTVDCTLAESMERPSTRLGLGLTGATRSAHRVGSSLASRMGWTISSRRVKTAFSRDWWASMRREVRQLRQRAIESLVLSIELFNRPRNEGRIEGVLIHADRAFEMLLKAAIRHQGGQIREPGDPHTIGFQACVNKCLTDAHVKCLVEDDAVTLTALNGWRDAAQHYLLDLSEEQLYLACQASVTLFDRVLVAVFDDHLRTHLPDRVLPVSTNPPRDLGLLLDGEFDVISQLLRPNSRKLDLAKTRLRAIGILEAATLGVNQPPNDQELDGQITRLRAGHDWRDVFPGVAKLDLVTEGSGLTYSLRISKREGLPVKLVTEATGGEAVIAVKRVNELDFYCFGFKELAGHVKDSVSEGRLQAVISYLRLRESPEYFKEIAVGHARFGRYSQAALSRLRLELIQLDIDAVWAATKEQRRARRSASSTAHKNITGR